MANVRQREMPRDPACKEIVKTLAELCYSRRQDEVFDMWLEAVDGLMTMLPAHAKSVAATGKPAQDTLEVAETMARLAKRFGAEWPKAQEIFTKAWVTLMFAAHDEEGKPDYQDRLGEIYMAWSWPNSGTGQFFTPWDIASLMAMMTVQDGEAEVYQRLTEAYLKSGAGAMHRFTGRTDEQIAAFVREMGPKILPYCIEYYQPLTVSDCCCGSGVMLLAAASRFPAWMVNMGLVQFYGQDIDMTCVLMAKINLATYGMNGYGLKCYLEMAQAEIERLPLQPAQLEVIAKAKQAHIDGDSERVAELAFDFRQMAQMSMFPAESVAA